MKSLSELADIYQNWATANEACADGILAAAKLPELESGMHELVQDGYKIPKDPFL